MIISALETHFDVTQYQLAAPQATVELVGGEMVVRAQYKFRNANGEQKGGVTEIDMVVTQQQNDDLRAILAAVLSATNAALESATGWTAWIKTEEV